MSETEDDNVNPEVENDFDEKAEGRKEDIQERTGVPDIGELTGKVNDREQDVEEDIQLEAVAKKNNEKKSEQLAQSQERKEWINREDQHLVGKEDNQGSQMNFEDFSAMTIEQLDSFLHENEGEAYEEEEEERDEECDEESGEPSLHEDNSADSGQDRMPSEFLNADNPLMAKFQAILKIHLLGEIAKLREDSAELGDRYEQDLLAFRDAGEQMERLAAQKSAGDKRIEELQEKLDTSKGERERVRKDHTRWKKRSEEEEENFNEVEKNYQALMLKTEHLSRTAQQLETLELKRQSELSIARIQSAKSTKEIENLLSNDLKQDILSLMINREINKLERSLAEAEAQYGAKTVEMRTMLERLGDARADLSSMERENKKINEAWSQLVAGIQAKQKEFLDAQDEARTIREKLRELEISTVNTRKAWTDEKYDGEKITAELNRYVSNVDNLSRTIQRKETLRGNLHRQLMTLSKIVDRDESHIAEFTRLETRMNKELQILTSTCDGLATAIRQFENEILEKYQTDFVVNNKELTAVSEDIRRLKRQNQESELELAAYDYKISATRLDMDRMQGLKRQAEAELNAVKQDVAAKLRQIQLLERKIETIKGRVSVIQGKIQQETQALEHLTKEENSKSPTEKLIAKLNEENDTLCFNLKNLKSQWLRKQSHLIDLMEEHNKNLASINELEWQNHECGIKLNKQSRTGEEKSIEHDKLLSSVERLKKRIDREAQKTVHKKDFEAVLNEENVLRQDMYYSQLQDAEKELYCLKQSILELENEERTYLREIERAESLYLSWEKKCTLASKEKEKYEMEKKPGGEIEQLKREIHRMEMRYAQLKNVQKKLMSDLEACVTRRERIMDNVRARAKRSTKEDTKRYIHVKKVQQLRTQIKQVQVEMKTMEKLSEEYKTKKEDLINENTNKQNQLKSLQENIEKVERQLQEGYLHKQKNLEILIHKQRRCRHYCQLKDGKYRPLFRTEASLELESMKQSDTNQSLVSLLGTLLGDFPSLQYSFRKILNTLKLN